MLITFSMWAPDQDTFWQAMIAAGICTAPGELSEAYAGCVEFFTSWPGIVMTVTGTDPQTGEPTYSQVPGWHTNIRVFGQVAEEMTHGLNQYDDQGNLLPIWDRTWAVQVFNLTEVGMDPVTKFPTGYRSDKFGVRYCDFTALKTPSLIIA